MNRNELKLRLKYLAIKTGWLCNRIPENFINKIYIDLVAYSTSSSALHYRTACRGKSNAMHINKLGIVEEKLNETILYYEIMGEFNPEFKVDFRELYIEANELISIITTSINSSKSKAVKETVLKKSRLIPGPIAIGINKAKRS